MKVASLSNHSILRTCMTDLGWYQRKQKQSFSNSRRQLAPNARESDKVTSFIQHILHKWDLKIMLIKVSNTSLMFNMNHGGDKMLLMGSIATHQNFHITGFPPSCEHGDGTGQTKRCNGVCSRNQPRVRQHYEHRWF